MYSLTFVPLLLVSLFLCSFVPLEYTVHMTKHIRFFSFRTINSCQEPRSGLRISFRLVLVLEGIDRMRLFWKCPKAVFDIRYLFVLPLCWIYIDTGIQYAKRGRPGPGEGFAVNFIMQDGEEISVQAHENESLLDVAWANDIDIEGKPPSYLLGTFDNFSCICAAKCLSNTFLSYGLSFSNPALGACEASLACSTCHLILDPDSYSKLEEPTDEENDMLDLAFGLTDTYDDNHLPRTCGLKCFLCLTLSNSSYSWTYTSSRLGCQVLMNKELDGIVAKLPTMTRNA